MTSKEQQLDDGVIHHKFHPKRGVDDPYEKFKEIYFIAQQIETKTTWMPGMDVKYVLGALKLKQNLRIT